MYGEGEGEGSDVCEVYGNEFPLGSEEGMKRVLKEKSSPRKKQRIPL